MGGAATWQAEPTKSVSATELLNRVLFSLRADAAGPAGCQQVGVQLPPPPVLLFYLYKRLQEVQGDIPVLTRGSGAPSGT